MDTKKIFTLVAVCAMALPVLTGCDKEMTDEEIGQAYERYLDSKKQQEQERKEYERKHLNDNLTYADICGKWDLCGTTAPEMDLLYLDINEDGFSYGLVANQYHSSYNYSESGYVNTYKDNDGLHLHIPYNLDGTEYTKKFQVSFYESRDTLQFMLEGFFYEDGTEAPDEFGEKGALIWLVRHETPTDQLTK